MVKEIERVVVRRGRKEGAGMDWEVHEGPRGWEEQCVSRMGVCYMVLCVWQQLNSILTFHAVHRM